jgi:hypothetical protein
MRLLSLSNHSACSLSSSRQAVRIDRGELVELRFGNLFAAAPVQILEARHPAQCRLAGVRLAAAAADDPLQDAHVLAEAGPHEIALGILAEPVDGEDARRVFDLVADAQPVVEVIAHVVAAEGQHGERVAAHDTLRAGRRRSGFGAECGDAM